MRTLYMFTVANKTIWRERVPLVEGLKKKKTQDN